MREIKLHSQLFGRRIKMSALVEEGGALCPYKIRITPLKAQWLSVFAKVWV
jgi:hypothetical protein